MKPPRTTISPPPGTPRAPTSRLALVPSALAAGIAFALSSCGQISPAKVCGAPETLQAVSTILQGGESGDPTHRATYAELTTIDTVTFQGRDVETETITCHAEVRLKETGRSFPIVYTRQPTVDGEPVYYVRYDSTDEWNIVGIAVQKEVERRDRAAAGMYPSRSPTTAEEPLDAAPVWAAQPTAPAVSTNASTTPASASTSATPSSAAERAVSENRAEYTAPPALVTNPNPAAAPAHQRPAVLAQVSWSRRPNAGMPAAAVDAGISSGSASLECVVQPNGRPSDCRVLSETPSGFGLGDAAVAAAHRSQLSPRSVDSVAERGLVRFTLRFEAE